MSIKAFLLDGLLSYPDDDDAASQEVAVRAIRLANQWTASCAAIAVFRTLMGITGAAAWTMADDKERFESTYGSVLDMASKLDTGVFYAFFTFKQFTWDEMPRHELFGKAWESICERSGRTMDQWVSMAKKLDYKAIASAPENAAIIAIYCNGYDDFLKSAAGTPG